MYDQSNTKKTVVGNFCLTNRIGSGAYAEVFKGVDIRDDSSVAIKVISRNKISHPKLHENLQSEIAILRDYNHPNIVRLYDHFNSNKYIFLVLELCEGGDLAKYIKKFKSISESLSIKFLKQIASGLMYLSQKQLIHRDLKPANILLTEFTENAVLKLADFGFAKQLKDEIMMTQTRCGTPLYMSPEVLENQHYDATTDLWSTGVIFFEMLVGEVPYKGINEFDLLNNIKTKALSLPSNLIISSNSIMLMKGLLERDPNQRISLEIFSNALDQFSADDKGMLDKKVELNKSYPNAEQRDRDSSSSLVFNQSIATEPPTAMTYSGKKTGNLNNTKSIDTITENIRGPISTHRRYSSDQSDSLHAKNKQKSDMQSYWFPVTTIGKALISLTSPPSSSKNRIRSSSADAVFDGFGNSNQSYSNSEEDFVMVDYSRSQAMKRQQTAQLKEEIIDDSKVLLHVQNASDLCNTINIIITIANSMIKDAISHESRSRVESIDGQILNNYICACSLYLHLLQLLNEFISTTKTVITSLFQNSILHQQPLNEIITSLLKYNEILIVRVEQCCNKISLTSSAPCHFPTPESVIYKAAINLATDAYSVDELLGNLDNALNKYSDARTLMEYIISKSNDNDKSKLNKCLDIISDQYGACQELNFLSH